jgi:hypothetical protein
MANTSQKQDNGYRQITLIIIQEMNQGNFAGIDLHSNNSYIAVIDTDNGCGSKPRVWLVLNHINMIENLSHP